MEGSGGKKHSMARNNQPKYQCRCLSEEDNICSGVVDERFTVKGVPDAEHSENR